MDYRLQDAAYERDHRVLSRLRVGQVTNIDRRTMTADVRLPDYENEIVTRTKIRFEVCPTCRGRGSHTNPSIDAHGLTREDFEDREFAEMYWGGVYDTQCFECGGEKVVPRPTDKKVMDLLDEYWREEAEYAAICAAERRMGC